MDFSEFVDKGVLGLVRESFSMRDCQCHEYKKSTLSCSPSALPPHSNSTLGNFHQYGFSKPLHSSQDIFVHTDAEEVVKSSLSLHHDPHHALVEPTRTVCYNRLSSAAKNIEYLLADSSSHP